MRRTWTSLATALLLAGCAESGPANDEKCVMREVARMPVLNNRGSPIVKVRVNGTPVAFVVDTGASNSSVTSDAADQLGLTVDHDHYAMLSGMGGSTMAYQATINSLDLGTAAAHQAQFWEIGSFGHATVAGLTMVGLFGGDFLASYDVDFDLPAHRVSLYAEQHCNAAFNQPWEGVAYKEPFSLENMTVIRLQTQVNGHSVQMQFDSGADGTILDMRAASAAGVTPASLASDQKFMARGIDGIPTVAHVHRFDSLEIGPELIKPKYMGVADIQVNPLLGADFLRSHRVWISYPHELMWVQPVGPIKITGPLTTPPAASRPNRLG